MLDQLGRLREMERSTEQRFPLPGVSCGAEHDVIIDYIDYIDNVDG